MLTGRDALRQVLEALGALLEARAHRADLVVIGGGALLLDRVLQRSTKDLDVLGRLEGSSLVSAEPFPGPLIEAVGDVAAAFGLAPDWLNPGPTSLLDLGMPEGFLKRTRVETFHALTLRCAHRWDQVHFKVYAAADHWPARSKHLQDLEALVPTQEELSAAADWCQTHDRSTGFREHLLAPLLAYMRERSCDGA